MVDMSWQKSLKPASKAVSGGASMSPAQKVAASMDKALAIYKSDETVKRPVIKLVGANVQFSVRFANQALELAPGIKIAEVPAAQFEKIYGAIKASVLEGAFDKQLEPLAKSAKARGAKMVAGKAAKK